MSASSSRRLIGKMSRLKFCYKLAQKSQICGQQRIRDLSVHAGSSSTDPGQLFIRSDVQNILKTVTGFDLDKIFATRLTDVKPPKYKLLTDQELQEVRLEAMERGKEMLQMPPVLKPRDTESRVLSEDPEIKGYETHNIVFTDITYGVPDKDRAMVVREPGGRLRMADSEERDRLLHVYFPREGRNYQTPQMFSENNLERLLQEERYLYILDRACVQFEPDDPHYIRVTQKVYDFIADRHQYYTLRTTRHFGPMTFHLTYHNKPEGLMVDMIERDLITDAASVVRLHNIIHPGTVSAKLHTSSPNVSELQLIQTYADNDTPHGGPIQLALQAYKDSQNHATSQAH